MAGFFWFLKGFLSKNPTATISIDIEKKYGTENNVLLTIHESVGRLHAEKFFLHLFHFKLNFLFTYMGGREDRERLQCTFLKRSKDAKQRTDPTEKALHCFCTS